MRLRARSEKELKEAARDDAHVVKIKTAYAFSTRSELREYVGLSP